MKTEEKPLFRWTCGPCLQQGLDILAESIQRTTAALGEDRFDWMICYNGLNSDQLEFIKGAIGNKNIILEPQNWIDCAIPDQCRFPTRPDGSFELDGKRCGGTLWKVAPARKRINAHEIVMDNDIVILKKIPAIEEFLEQTEKVMILEEPIRFYGAYDEHFEEGGPYLNSGLMGFCPGYDFGKAIREKWENTTKWSEDHGKFIPHFNISQADEQGLLMLALKDMPNIRIDLKYVSEVLAKSYSKKINGSEYAIHFTQANRVNNHNYWEEYKKIVINNTVF